MNIPKTFEMGSRTWTVKRGVRMYALGDCDGARCRIRLSRKNKSDGGCIHRTFYRLDLALAKVFVRVTDTCIHTGHVLN